MIPVALEEGGSLVVLPTVAGFLFALIWLWPCRLFDTRSANHYGRIPPNDGHGQGD
jgi:hypothetical protein